MSSRRLKLKYLPGKHQFIRQTAGIVKIAEGVDGKENVWMNVKDREDLQKWEESNLNRGLDLY